MYLSVGAAKALLTRQEVAKIYRTDISFVDGGTGDDYLETVAGDFVAAKFGIGQTVNVMGSTSNNITAVITNVTATKLYVATGTLTTEAAGDSVCAFATDGGSWLDLFTNCNVAVYAGRTSWASAGDDATSGYTKLIEYTDCNFGTVQYDSVNKQAYIQLSALESATAVASGTASFARIYKTTTSDAADRDNVTVVSSFEPIRFDVTVGITGSSAEFIVGSTVSYTAGEVRPLGIFNIRQDQS